MKRFLVTLFLAGLALGTSATWARAEDTPSQKPKPIAVVSLAGYDAFLGDVNYVGQLVNNRGLGASLEGMLKLFTNNQGLAGLDKTRPWGAVILDKGNFKSGYAFIPVTDLAKLGVVLEPFLGKPEDLGEGVYKIHGKKNPPFFVKENNGWAFLSDKQENLTNLPDDPSVMLGGLEKRYQIAVRLDIGNVPEAFCQKFIDGMKKTAEMNERRRPHESDEEFASRFKLPAEIVVKRMEMALNELQEITLGWNLDTKAEKCYLEASFIAKPGTELAKSTESLRNSHSRFAGFGSNDAAIVGNINGQMPMFKTELLLKAIDEVRQNILIQIAKNEHDNVHAELGKKFIEQLTPMLQETVKQGRVDGGMAVVLKPDTLTVLAGGTLVNNGRIEAMAKLALEAAKEKHPAAPDWVKLGAEEFQGVTLHTISIPIPADDGDRQKIVPLIGETLEIVIGTSKDSAYIAAGREPLAALKKAIEQSAANASKSVPPMEITVSLTKVMEFVATVGEERDRPRAAKIAAALLKQSPGSDRVILNAQPLDNGVKYRLEIEPGVLKAFVQMP